jgi:hypothetical protein
MHGLAVVKRALETRLSDDADAESELSQTETEGPKPEDSRAKVFRDRDREHEGDWRVEKMDDDGGAEVALFSGGDARQRAISYADREYGEFDEIELRPYHYAPDLGQVLDDLSRSGVAVSIEAMPGDVGYAFSLGDTGTIEGSAENIFDLVMGLIAYTIEHFPDSRFAEQYRGKTF